MKIAEKIQYLRKTSNMSQDKLAESLNVSRQAISKWESGQNYPDIENIKLLSKLFDISIDQLVHDDLGVEKQNKKPVSNDLIYVLVGMVIGMALGVVSGNYMLVTAGGFVGLAYAILKP